MISEWIHIGSLWGDTWVLPIWNAIHEAEKKQKVKKAHQRFGEISLHISTRLDMLPIIGERIRKERDSLFEQINNHEPGHVFSKGKDGYVFKIDDNKLKYYLLIDIDSFLFEMDSCCELMTEYVGMVYEHIGKTIPKKEIGNKIKEIIENAGLENNWYLELNKHRNFFIHEGTPYFAVDISNSEKYDLLIMKENLKNFTDEKKFVKLADLGKIENEFYKSKGAIQKHLIDLYNKL